MASTACVRMTAYLTPPTACIQVDPVVFQCYKTAACFLSSFLVLTYVEFKFTW